MEGSSVVFLPFLLLSVVVSTRRAVAFVSRPAVCLLYDEQHSFRQTKKEDSQMKTPVWLGKIAAVAVLCVVALHAQEAAPRHAYVRVIVGKNLPGPVSGRLLIFATNAASDAGK